MTNTAFLAGATDKSVVVRAIVISTGLPKTDLAYNTATIVGSYWRGGMGTPPSATSFTLATQTVSGAHSDGGFVHIANGVYRFDMPDACIASGADWVAFAFSGVADCFITGCFVDIVGVDPRSATAPDVNLTKILGTAVATPATAGLLDVNVKEISSDATAANNLELAFDGTGYAGGTTKQDVNVATITANAITAAATASDFGAEIADAVWDEALSGHATAGSAGVTLGTAGADLTTLLGAIILSQGTIGATGNDTTHAHVDDVVSNGDDEYNDHLIIIFDASNSFEPAVRWISDFVASTELATLSSAIQFTPASGDPYYILSIRQDVTGGSGLDAAGVRAAVGLASANLDTQLTAIDDLLDTEVAAIKAKTDSLTFTVANVLDANVQRINDVTITGNGSPGTEFGV